MYSQASLSPSIMYSQASLSLSTLASIDETKEMEELDENNDDEIMRAPHSSLSSLPLDRRMEVTPRPGTDQVALARKLRRIKRRLLLEHVMNEPDRDEDTKTATPRICSVCHRDVHDENNAAPPAASSE